MDTTSASSSVIPPRRRLSVILYCQWSPTTSHGTLTGADAGMGVADWHATRPIVASVTSRRAAAEMRRSIVADTSMQDPVVRFRRGLRQAPLNEPTASAQMLFPHDALDQRFDGPRLVEPADANTGNPPSSRR